MKPYNKKYACTTCSRTVTVAGIHEEPGCCGGKMEEIPLEPCVNAPHAEMARNGEIEDACDDGRGV